jgi:hypothetical protein
MISASSHAPSGMMAVGNVSLHFGVDRWKRRELGFSGDIDQVADVRVVVAANSGGRSASAAGLLIAANSAQVDHPLETGNGRCSHGPAWTTACLVLAPGPV